jgi:hypothetical protein
VKDVQDIDIPDDGGVFEREFVEEAADPSAMRVLMQAALAVISEITAHGGVRVGRT